MREFFEYTGVSLGISTIFIGTAALHRLGLSDPGYVTSPLINVEMILLVIMFLGVFALSIAVIAFVLLRKWKSAGYVTLNVLIIFVAIYAGMAIDSPTLIYMT